MFHYININKKIKRFFAIFFVFIVLFSLNGPVLGLDDELDQFQIFADAGIGVGNPDMLAQSFKPTDNLLTRVEVNIYKMQETEYNITIAIRNNLSSPNLTTKTLRSDEIYTSGQWIEFDFPDVQVIINETYYILLIPEGPGMIYVWRGYESTNPDKYDRGEAWLYANGQWNTDNFFINDWAFKTYKSHYSNPPLPPQVPMGPISGLSWTSLYYETVAIDPDEDDIKYGWDWNGDDVVDEWTPFYESDAIVNISHCFLNAGHYFIQVKAMDAYGLESAFSNKLAVNISNNSPSIPSTPKGPEIVTTTESASFSTNSSDPENQYIKYGWDWDGDNVVDEWTPFHQSGLTVNYSHKWVYSGTYNVKVKAIDEYGAQSTFSDSSRIVVFNIENDPPEKPERPIGKSLGWKGLSYSYGTQTLDPNNDLIWYKWDWDDGTTSDWIGPYESGQSCNVSHTWQTRGEFQIKVKAKDESGAESVWSDSLPISMPITIPKILVLILSFLEEILSLQE